jgi:hypothetical protein
MTRAFALSSRLVSLAALALTAAACGDDPSSSGTDAGSTGDASAVLGDASSLDGGGGDAGTPRDPSAPTWYADIAPLVVPKCGGCHEQGGIAPFSLRDYASAKPMAELMANAVEAGRMPPFLAQETDACAPKLPWKEDQRLSDAEKKLLRRWADTGAVEGDPASAKDVSDPTEAKLAREDVVLKIPKEVTVSGSKDLHKCIIIDPKLAKDTYVVGRLITSGNAKVLHHVVSYLLKPKSVPDVTTLFLTQRAQTRDEFLADLKADTGVGPGEEYDCFGGPALETVTFEMLDAWAPGVLPNMAPPESGQPMSKDDLVLLDVHYHPTGGEEKDSATKLSLMTSDEKPKRIARTVLIGNFEGRREVPPFGVGELLKQSDETTAAFGIPADAKDHVEEMTWTWTLPNQLDGTPTTIRVFGMGTHMHYVGRGMRVSLEHKTPSTGEDAKECLIETPSWDFNWQRGYAFDADFEKLPQMRNGDVLRFRCIYDNTMGNKFVVDALSEQKLDKPKDVVLGEDTLDEMCLGALGIIYPNPN